MAQIEAFGGPFDGAIVEIPDHRPGRSITLAKSLMERVAPDGTLSAEDDTGGSDHLAVYRLRAGRKRSAARLDFEGWA